VVGEDRLAPKFFLQFPTNFEFGVSRGDALPFGTSMGQFTTTEYCIFSSH